MNQSKLLGQRLANSSDDYQMQQQFAESQHAAFSGEEIEELSKTVREKLNKMFGQDIHTERNNYQFRDTMRRAIEAILNDQQVRLGGLERQRFVTDMMNDILGFGPIQPLVDDETLTEIMVVGPNKVYIERNGQLQLTDIKFPSKNAVKLLIDKIVGPLGRRCDESTPNVDARLPDGSRVSASIDPIALDGPYITIRKFGKKTFTLQDYVGRGSASPEMVQFLEAAINAELNIFVSGGTGSGKTTLLNCLSNYIDPSTRILTVEDSAELQLQQPHVERYEARPANVEGKGAIHIRDLVIYALRKRPDRIVVGEIRGGEAMDMLQAMNTGHDGSLTTGHANSPKQMINRLETMCLMAGLELPSKAIRETIAGAIHLIVQISRLQDGSRKITHITEVIGMGKEAAEILGLKNYEKEVVYLQDIFRFVQTGKDEDGRVVGKFVATGHKPLCIEKFESHGIFLPASMFDPMEV
ncbi:CpaF family protein [Cytobacillus sp. FJAT-54145]|uniref:CpaF family protein n=1 Tax=Cytobacillus spartinae TaxID=3299023 RepID=A0ABW6KAP2_9BACI